MVPSTVAASAAAAATAAQPAMKILLIAILMTNFIAGRTDAAATADYDEKDEACNCDHCEVADVQPINATANSFLPPYNKEDADMDGSLKICARDRDLPDKSFPSVCHMLCYNRCTRFNKSVVDEGTYKRYIATAYRTNYYKLHDGLCE